MHIAAQKGAREIIASLIERGVNVNLGDYQGTTPLMLAAIGNKKTAVEELCKSSNIDIEKIEPKNGLNALMLACEKGNIDVVKILIDRGTNINSQNYFGWTVLMLAVLKNKLHIVEYLIGKEANMSMVNNQNHTALMIADEKGFSEIANFLKKHGK